MKKTIMAALTVCLFFIMLPSAKALTSYAIKNKCTIKTEANENGSFLVQGVIHYLDPGDIITLVDGSKIASTNDKCSTEYYYVTFSGKKGYVCGDYINLTTEGKYYEELKNAGFPDSYLLSLNALKEQHPSWVFTSYKTGLDFEQSITNESNIEYNSNTGKYWSRSYIQTKNELYLSRQFGSYNSSDNTFNQMEPGGWYAANKQTVAYYMDPRNFLNIYDIFMFENLGYNSNYQTKEVVSKIFEGTDLLQYADFYIEAANAGENNVSPIFLGARSRQEVVLGDGKLSDSANGGSGVFNFYNIGANSSCDNPVACGLAYATKRGWTDARTAIIGGATEIANGYINKKQNTLYFQRFNVTGNVYGNYSNQYMTNIEAPKSESRSTYNAYSNMNLLDSALEFVIPVYENMPKFSSNLPTEIEQTEIISDLNQLLNEIGYSVNNNMMEVARNKTVTELVQEMNSRGITATINKEGIVGTGDVITIKYGETNNDISIVVKGDASGDGKVSAFDYMKIKNYIMGTGTLNDAYKQAADVNNDSRVSAFDYISIKNFIMGSESVLK